MSTKGKRKCESNKLSTKKTTTKEKALETGQDDANVNKENQRKKSKSEESTVCKSKPISKIKKSTKKLDNTAKRNNVKSKKDSKETNRDNDNTLDSDEELKKKIQILLQPLNYILE